MTGQTGQVFSRPVYALWDEMAPPIKYGLGYRSRTLTLNPKTDPNPNPNSDKNVRSTKRHQNKSQHSVI